MIFLCKKKKRWKEIFIRIWLELVVVILGVQRSRDSPPGVRLVDSYTPNIGFYYFYHFKFD